MLLSLSASPCVHCTVPPISLLPIYFFPDPQLFTSLVSCHIKTLYI